MLYILVKLHDRFIFGDINKLNTFITPKFDL